MPLLLLPLLLALPPADPPLSDLGRFPLPEATAAAQAVNRAEQERLQLRIDTGDWRAPQLEERLTDLRVREGCWQALEMARYFAGPDGDEKDHARHWLHLLRGRLGPDAYWRGVMPYPVDTRWMRVEP